MYVVGLSADTFFQYSLSTGWDLSTASYDSVSFSVRSQDGAPLGSTFNSDGTKLYFSGGINDSVYQYSLSTAFDLSTASYDSVSFSVASQEGNPQGLFFNPDGTKLFLNGRNSDAVHQYSLSTAFDLSTASYDNVSFGFLSQDGNSTGISFNNTGSKLYMIGYSSCVIYQYSTT